ncbi:MAG: hypothetical protein JWM11_2916 [Planctomycetaceae bacterium]|nr:hypothetical protein [Planctomycetaceae bacterium]
MDAVIVRESNCERHWHSQWHPHYYSFVSAPHADERTPWRFQHPWVTLLVIPPETALGVPAPLTVDLIPKAALE